MPTPEQQAERAAAWKACYDADQCYAKAIRRWAEVINQRVREPDPFVPFTLDGVVYLPDGTTRAAP